MRVLVTEGEQRNALAVVRSLGRGGFHVIAGSHHRTAPSLFSRYCRTAIHYPDPRSNPKEFVAALRDKAAVLGSDVILPCHESTTVAIAGFRKDLESTGAAVLCPEPSLLGSVRDKLELGHIAQRLGIPTPRTIPARTFDEVARAAAQIGFPCVVKPRSGTGAIGMRLLQSERDLAAFSCRINRSSDSVFDWSCLLVQQYITGETHDLCALVRQGSPRVLLTQRRLRTYPAKGGRCVFGETTNVDAIRQYSAALLGELGYHGPVQVEFRYDPASEGFQLIEVNPRFWGSIELAIRAGIDFPILACRLALEGDIQEVHTYRTGLRMHWFFPYELASILQSPKPFRSLAQFLTAQIRGAYAGSALDPLPFLAQILYLLKTARDRRQHST